MCGGGCVCVCVDVCGWMYVGVHVCGLIVSVWGICVVVNVCVVVCMVGMRGWVWVGGCGWMWVRG